MPKSRIFSVCVVVITLLYARIVNSDIHIRSPRFHLNSGLSKHLPERLASGSFKSLHTFRRGAPFSAAASNPGRYPRSLSFWSRLFGDEGRRGLFGAPYEAKAAYLAAVNSTRNVTEEEEYASTVGLANVTSSVLTTIAARVKRDDHEALAARKATVADAKLDGSTKATTLRASKSRESKETTTRTGRSAVTTEKSSRVSRSAAAKDGDKTAASTSARKSREEKTSTSSVLTTMMGPSGIGDSVQSLGGGSTAAEKSAAATTTSKRNSADIGSTAAEKSATFTTKGKRGSVDGASTLADNSATATTKSKRNSADSGNTATEKVATSTTKGKRGSVDSASTLAENSATATTKSKRNTATEKSATSNTKGKRGSVDGASTLTENSATATTKSKRGSADNSNTATEKSATSTTKGKRGSVDGASTLADNSATGTTKSKRSSADGISTSATSTTKGKRGSVDGASTLAENSATATTKSQRNSADSGNTVTEKSATSTTKGKRGSVDGASTLAENSATATTKSKRNSADSGNTATEKVATSTTKGKRSSVDGASTFAENSATATTKSKRNSADSDNTATEKVATSTTKGKRGSVDGDNTATEKVATSTTKGKRGSVDGASTLAENSATATTKSKRGSADNSNTATEKFATSTSKGKRGSVDGASTLAENSATAATKSKRNSADSGNTATEKSATSTTKGKRGSVDGASTLAENSATATTKSKRNSADGTSTSAEKSVTATTKSKRGSADTGNTATEKSTVTTAKSKSSGSTVAEQSTTATTKNKRNSADGGSTATEKPAMATTKSGRDGGTTISSPLTTKAASSNAGTTSKMASNNGVTTSEPSRVSTTKKSESMTTGKDVTTKRGDAAVSTSTSKSATTAAHSTNSVIGNNANSSTKSTSGTGTTQKSDGSTTKSFPVTSTKSMNGGASTALQSTVGGTTTASSLSSTTKLDRKGETANMGTSSATKVTPMSQNADDKGTTKSGRTTAATTGTSISGNFSTTGGLTTVGSNSSLVNGNSSRNATEAAEKIAATVCPQGQVFCLITWKCVPNDQYYDLETGRWYEQQLEIFGKEVICEKNGICQSTNCKKISCRLDEIYCLETESCVKCPSSESVYHSEFPEFPHTTESPIQLSSVDPHMCPKGEVYTLPVAVYCRENEECPLNAKCCYVSERDKNKLPTCVWIARHGDCPSFMDYCKSTSKCHLPTEACNGVCQRNWKFCPETKRCIESGASCNDSKSKASNSSVPFKLPKMLLPSLDFRRIRPIHEDHEFEIRIRETFDMEGLVDYPMDTKDELLLRFLQEHLSWNVEPSVYYDWVANFSAFLSVKESSIEIRSAETVNKATYFSPEAAFPCAEGVLLKYQDTRKHNNTRSKTWNTQCGKAGLRLKFHHLLKLQCRPNYNGEVALEILPLVVDVGGKKKYGETVSMTLEVTPVHDSPMVRTEMADVDVEIPYVTIVDPKRDDGIVVRDIVSTYFYEPDGEDLGMAVISAQSDGIGTWEYKLPDSGWMPISNIDKACSILKYLEIPDVHQGAVFLDGMVPQDTPEEHHSRHRRSLVFSNDTTNSTYIATNSSSNHPLSKKTQAEFRPYYSDDFKALAESVPPEKIVDPTRDVAVYNGTNIEDLDLYNPWRKRHPVPSTALNCTALALDDVTTSTPAAVTTFKPTNRNAGEPEVQPTGAPLTMTITDGQGFTTTTYLTSSVVSTWNSGSTGRATSGTAIDGVTTRRAGTSDGAGPTTSIDSKTTRSATEVTTLGGATRPTESRNANYVNSEDATTVTSAATGSRNTRTARSGTDSANSAATTPGTSKSANFGSASSAASMNSVTTASANSVTTASANSVTTASANSRATVSANTGATVSANSQATASANSGTTAFANSGTPASANSGTTVSANSGTPASSANSGATQRGSSGSTMSRTSETTKSGNSGSTSSATTGSNISGNTKSPNTASTQSGNSASTKGSIGAETGTRAPAQAVTTAFNSTTRREGSTTGGNSSSDGLTNSSVVNSSTMTSGGSITTTPVPTTTPAEAYHEADADVVEHFRVHLEALFLPPTARLRFVSKNGTETWWSILSAMASSKLTFLAWDQSDKKVSGTKHNVSVRLCSMQNENCSSDGSLSGHLAVIRQRRFDCPSQSSLLFSKVPDECGVCGGNGKSCKDCSGAVHGDAVLDCSTCVGGNTGKELFGGRDCAFTCNENRSLTFGNTCNREVEKEFVRCNNNSKTSFINECGSCQTSDSNLTDAIGDEESPLCGRCPNVSLSHIWENHFRYFNCDNLWKRNLLEEAIAFGSQPYLRWEKSPEFGQSVYADLAAFTDSTLLMHIYGQSWSYQMDFFESVTCDLVDFSGEVVAPLKSWLKVDRLQIKLTAFEAGDYRVACRMMTPHGDYHSLTPFAKLSVVDSRRLWIQHCSHQQITAGTNTTISFSGSGFVNTNDLSCFVIRHPSKFAKFLSKARFAAEGNVSCFIGANAFDASMSIDVGVVLTSQVLKQYNAGHFSTLSSATIEVKADKSPRLISAIVSDDLRSIVAIFDCNVEFRECGKLFDNMEIFGANFSCESNADKIIVYSNVNLNELVGKTLTISASTDVRCLFAPNSGSVAQGSATLTGAVNATPLAIRLIGPERATPAAAYFQVVVLSGNGGRPVMTRWSVKPKDNSTYKALQEELNRLPSNAMNLTFPEKYLSNMSNCVVEVTVVDYLKREVVQSVEYANSNTWAANLNIIGPEIVHPQHDIVLTAHVTLNEKYSSTRKRPQLTFYWEISDNRPTVNINNVRGNVVKIEKGSLEGGATYNVQCLVILNGDPSQYATASFNLSTTLGKPIAVTSVTDLDVPVTRGFQIGGALSHDPFKPSKPLKFHWSCFSQAHGYCYSVSNSSVRLLETLLNATIENPVLFVDGHLLSIGRYTFKLTVLTVDGREANTEVNVNIHTYRNAPSITVAQDNAFRVRPASDVSLRAFVTAPAGTEIGWECSRQRGFDYFDVSSSPSTGWYKVLESDVTDMPFTTLLRSSIEPKDPWWTRMRPGSRYAFVLTARHPMEGETSTKVIVETSPSPSIKDIQVTPKSGLAVFTPFSIDLGDFRLDETVSVLHVGYYIPSNNVTSARYLREFSRYVANLNDLRLPAVDKHSGKVMVVVKACNSDDVCSISVAGIVEVNMPQLTMQEHLHAILNTVTEKMDEGDLASALTRAISCIQTLHVAGITSGATLQQLVWTTEMLIRRLAARIEIPVDAMYTSREESFNTLNAACLAFQDVRPSKDTLMSLLTLQSKMLDVYVRRHVEEDGTIPASGDAAGATAKVPKITTEQPKTKTTIAQKSTKMASNTTGTATTARSTSKSASGQSASTITSSGISNGATKNRAANGDSTTKMTGAASVTTAAPKSSSAASKDSSTKSGSSSGDAKTTRLASSSTESPKKSTSSNSANSDSPIKANSGAAASSTVSSGISDGAAKTTKKRNANTDSSTRISGAASVTTPSTKSGSTALKASSSSIGDPKTTKLESSGTETSKKSTSRAASGASATTLSAPKEAMSGAAASSTVSSGTSNGAKKTTKSLNANSDSTTRISGMASVTTQSSQSGSAASKASSRNSRSASGDAKTTKSASAATETFKKSTSGAAVGNSDVPLKASSRAAASEVSGANTIGGTRTTRPSKQTTESSQKAASGASTSGTEAGRKSRSGSSGGPGDVTGTTARLARTTAPSGTISGSGKETGTTRSKRADGKTTSVTSDGKSGSTASSSKRKDSSSSGDSTKSGLSGTATTKASRRVKGVEKAPDASVGIDGTNGIDAIRDDNEIYGNIRGARQMIRFKRDMPNTSDSSSVGTTGAAVSSTMPGITGTTASLASSTATGITGTTGSLASSTATGITGTTASLASSTATSMSTTGKLQETTSGSRTDSLDSPKSGLGTNPSTRVSGESDALVPGSPAHPRRYRYRKSVGPKLGFFQPIGTPTTNVTAFGGPFLVSEPGLPLSGTQAESLLGVTDLALEAGGTSQAAVYRQLLSDLPDMWMALCLGIAPDNGPLVAVSNAVVLQVAKVDFAEAVAEGKNYPFIDAREEARGFVKLNSYYHLGISSASMNNSKFHCNGLRPDCGVVCVGSAQFKEDPLTTALGLNTKSTSNALRRGDILVLLPVFYADGQEIDILDDMMRINVNISIARDNVTDSEIPYLKCAAWSNEHRTWNTELCNTLDIFKSAKVLRTTCKCSPTGFYGLYLDRKQAPIKSVTEIPTTTTTTSTVRPTSGSATKAQTTQDSNATTVQATTRRPNTTSPPSTAALKYYQIGFAFDGDYKTLVVNKANFILLMVNQFATLLDVPVPTFSSVTAEPGSVKVTMVVTPDPNGKYGDGPQLVDQISKLISENMFCFQGENNETLCAQKDSYNLISTNNAAMMQKHSMVGTIVGAIFGVVVGIVAICILRAFIRNKVAKNKVGTTQNKLGEVENTSAYYKSLKMNPTIPVFEGTIDSREQYRMKLNASPHMVPAHDGNYPSFQYDNSLLDPEDEDKYIRPSSRMSTFVHPPSSMDPSGAENHKGPKEDPSNPKPGVVNVSPAGERDVEKGDLQAPPLNAEITGNPSKSDSDRPKAPPPGNGRTPPSPSKPDMYPKSQNPAPESEAPPPVAGDRGPPKFESDKSTEQPLAPQDKRSKAPPPARNRGPPSKGQRR